MVWRDSTLVLVDGVKINRDMMMNHTIQSGLLLASLRVHKNMICTKINLPIIYYFKNSIKTFRWTSFARYTKNVKLSSNLLLTRLVTTDFPSVSTCSSEVVPHWLSVTCKAIPHWPRVTCEGANSRPAFFSTDQSCHLCQKVFLFF